jgi:diacylglycerol kinase family enzyme
VVAVGGDGTVSAVAGALVGTETPLGVIPAGTFNHFARDVGIPLKLEEAVSVLAAGTVRAIDVGEVNERTFVNNASIGAYPALVLDRDAQQMNFGRPKWRAMLIAGARVLHRFPRVEVRLALGAEAAWCETPCVFVGNNRYRFDALALGSRSALDHGRLSVYAAKANTRLAVLALGLKALLGKLEQDENLIALELEEFWIESRREQLHVGIDGEVVRLRTPLHFRIRPRCLKVIVPG